MREAVIAGPTTHDAVRPPLDARGLVLDRIVKRWPKRPDPVLDGVSLECPPGTLTLLSGDNGAGKTTLLRIAAGLIAPDSGDVSFGKCGSDVYGVPYRRSMGYLGVVSAGLYPRLKVKQHLDFWARLSFVAPARRGACIARVIDAFKLDELLDRRPDRLSMGQRQRVRLAGVFLHEPSAVYLDEPANSLDATGIDLLRNEVERARRRGVTLIWAHPFGEAAHLDFDATLRLSQGRLIPS